MILTGTLAAPQSRQSKLSRDGQGAVRQCPLARRNPQSRQPTFLGFSGRHWKGCFMTVLNGTPTVEGKITGHHRFCFASCRTIDRKIAVLEKRFSKRSTLLRRWCMLCEAAGGGAHQKTSYFGTLYRRLARTRGNNRDSHHRRSRSARGRILFHHRRPAFWNTLAIASPSSRFHPAACKLLSGEPCVHPSGTAGYSVSVFRYSRNASPRSWRFRANSTVAFRKPNLSPASYRVPSKR